MLGQVYIQLAFTYMVTQQKPTLVMGLDQPLAVLGGQWVMP